MSIGPRVSIQPGPHFSTLRSLFLPVEWETFTLVPTPDYADVVVVQHLNDLSFLSDLPASTTTVFVHDFFHTFEEVDRQLVLPPTKSRLVHLSTNTQLRPQAGIASEYVDFLFNRTKAYYTREINGRKVLSLDLCWYYAGHGAYTLPQHDVERKTRVFVSSNRQYIGRRPYRQDLYEVLKPFNGYASLSFVGDTEQVVAKLPADVPDKLHRLRYAPVARRFLEDSFIHIYVETITYGPNLVLTEKTLDPLIRGHFILPFSAPHFVKQVEARGFKLPNFINYSYDAIEDDTKRFKAFLEETKRLCAISLDNWKMFTQMNADVLKHNQSLFFDRAYERSTLL